MKEELILEVTSSLNKTPVPRKLNPIRGQTVIERTCLAFGESSGLHPQRRKGVEI